MHEFCGRCALPFRIAACRSISSIHLLLSSSLISVHRGLKALLKLDFQRRSPDWDGRKRETIRRLGHEDSAMHHVCNLESGKRHTDIVERLLIDYSLC